MSGGAAMPKNRRPSAAGKQRAGPKMRRDGGPGIFFVIALNDFPCEVSTDYALAIARRDEMQAINDRVEAEHDGKMWDPKFKRNTYHVTRCVAIPAQYPR